MVTFKTHSFLFVINEQREWDILILLNHMNDHIIQYGVIMNLLSPIKKSFFRTLENGFNVFLDGKAKYVS